MNCYSSKLLLLFFFGGNSSGNKHSLINSFYYKNIDNDSSLNLLAIFKFMQIMILYHLLLFLSSQLKLSFSIKKDKTKGGLIFSIIFRFLKFFVYCHQNYNQILE